MTLRARIWLLLLVALALVLMAAIALRSGYTTVAGTTTTVSTRLQPASDAVAALNTALAEMDSSVTSYALTSDVTELGTYVEGSGQATAEFENLRQLLAGQQELSQLLRETIHAHGTWKRQGTRPIIEATRTGAQEEARQLVRSGTSRNLYNDVRTYTRTLDEEIRNQSAQAQATQQEQFARLSRILNVSILLFFGLLAAFSTLLLRGVLRPLQELQVQLVDVAQESNHETPIAPSGPPELRDVGQDAETMRRELVREVDSARQANEGLAQQSPVVAAIRAELSDSHAQPVEGLDVAGVQEPAEGVLAGDWWSAQVLLDGRLAIVVTDVSGHGPEPGMEALRLKHVLELSLAQTADPATALHLAAAGFRTAARFATCIIAVLDPHSGELTWANAGHPPAWLVSGDVTAELATTGPLLSVLGGTWTNQRASMPLGAVLVLWTDGLTESRDDEGAELGDDGLAALVTDALDAEPTAAGFVAHLLAAARARATDWRRDDVTCVVVRRA